MTGFGVSLVTFAPNTTIVSADVNTNFVALNSAGSYPGTWNGLQVSSALISSQSAATVQPIAGASSLIMALASRDSSGTMHVGLWLAAATGNVIVPASITVGGVVNLQGGSLTAMTSFGGSGNQTISHGLGVAPTGTWVNYAGNFGSPPTQIPAWYNATTTQVTIVAGGNTWQALSYK